MKINKIFIPIFICLCLIAYVIGYASTTTTTNLSLVKPGSEDTTVNFFDTVNDNMDLIDAIFDTVTLTEFGYLDGVTSAIQDQFDAIGAGAVDTSGTPVANDIARFTDADTIEGLSYAEFKAALDLEIGTDIQAQDAGLQSIAGLTTAANKSIYTTALDTYAVYDLSAAGKALIDDADASAQRTTLGLVIGTNVQAFDNALTSISGLTYVSPSFIKLTANDTYAVRTLAEVKTDLSLNNVTNVATDDTAYNATSWDANSDAATKNAIRDKIETMGGYTNLTSFVEQTAWRLFYSNTDGDVTELALGADGTYLKSNGAAVAPTFDTPGGAGDMLKATYDTDEDSDVDVAAGGTEKSSWTQYCIPYLSTTTAFGEIPIGTDNYALTVNGATGYDWTEFQTPLTFGIADTNKVQINSATVADDDYAKFTATGLEGRSYSEVRTDLGLVIGTNVLAEQTIGIADNNLLEVDDADAADNDFAKFTANGLEGRSYAELMKDITPVTTSATTNTLTVAEAGLILVSNAHTETLPTASGNTGLTYHFIKTDYDYDLITLEGDGAETFNYENSTGSPNLTYLRLNTPCAEVTIVSDGTNWQVINERLGQVPYCKAGLTATQVNLVDATQTIVELDIEEYDIGSNFNTTTHLFTCPVAGEYLVTGNIAYTDLVANQRYFVIIYKGAVKAQVGYHNGDNTGALYGTNTSIIKASKDDDICLKAAAYCGANTVDVLGNGQYYFTYLQIQLIGKD